MKSLDAAYKVLCDAGKPLHVEEIARRVLDQKLWTTQGQTPEYTINTNILNDIKKYGATSRFQHLGHRTYQAQSNGAKPIMTSSEPNTNGPELSRLESAEIKTRVRHILTNLERVRESLLALSDDIWLNIDHNDPDALDEGVMFKRAYNEKMGAFNRQASDLSELIQQFTHVPIETPISAQNGYHSAADNERIIRELDRDTPHYLNEDMSYKRPYGFVLQGQAFKDIVTWQRVYKLTCLQLARVNPTVFRQLDTHRDFTSRRGNKDFSRNPDDLRSPLEIVHGMYVETNLSANNIRDHIKKLLNAFNIDQKSFIIYLREDRDAEEHF